jgi:hypothetical protein
MKLLPKQTARVRDAIEQWRHDGGVLDSQAATSATTIEVQYFD